LQAAVEKEKRKVPTSELTPSLICFDPFIHCTLQCFYVVGDERFPNNDGIDIDSSRSINIPSLMLALCVV
jgi:hypothetical protein